MWMLDTLQRSIDPLQAEEMVRDTTMARIASAKQDDFSKAIRRLNSIAEPGDTPPEPPPLIKPELEAWFEQNKIPYRLQ